MTKLENVITLLDTLHIYESYGAYDQEPIVEDMGPFEKMSYEEYMFKLKECIVFFRKIQQNYLEMPLITSIMREKMWISFLRVLHLLCHIMRKGRKIIWHFKAYLEKRNSKKDISRAKRQNIYPEQYIKFMTR